MALRFVSTKSLSNAPKNINPVLKDSFSSRWLEDSLLVSVDEKRLEHLVGISDGGARQETTRDHKGPQIWSRFDIFRFPLPIVQSFNRTRNVQSFFSYAGSCFQKSDGLKLEPPQGGGFKPVQNHWLDHLAKYGENIYQSLKPPPEHLDPTFSLDSMGFNGIQWAFMDGWPGLLNANCESLTTAVLRAISRSSSTAQAFQQSSPCRRNQWIMKRY